MEGYLYGIRKVSLMASLKMEGTVKNVKWRGPKSQGPLYYYYYGPMKVPNKQRLYR